MNTGNTCLYFIALVPPVILREQVCSIKMEVRDRFGPKHALKSPAHITLQRPFRRHPSFEKDLIDALTKWSADQRPFDIILHNFNCFEPRVIYINIEDHQSVIELFRSLKALLEQLAFSEKELSDRLHPHMTVVTRDMDENQFNNIWTVFRDRPFQESFRADRLYLLKHNGKFWDIYRSFEFGPERK